MKRKNRETILNKLDIVKMAIEALNREGKGDNWTSLDFWKKFITIRDYVKKLKHKDLQAIIN